MLEVCNVFQLGHFGRWSKLFDKISSYATHVVIALGDSDLSQSLAAPSNVTESIHNKTASRETLVC